MKNKIKPTNRNHKAIFDPTIKNGKCADDGYQIVYCRFCGKEIVPTEWKIRQHLEYGTAFYCDEKCRLQCPIYAREKLNIK